MDGTKAVLKGIPSTTESTMLKPHQGRGATEKIVWEHGPMSVTNDNVLKLLHDFINQFMSGGYNVLMQSVCEDIEKEHPSIQNSDIVTFFQVAQSITSFQFHKSSASSPAIRTEETSELCTNQNAGVNFSKSDICAAPIAATINDRMFLLVISKWRCAFDGLKETKDFKFLSAAGSLVKTMLCLLDLVIRLLPEDSREAFTVRILLYKLFYDQTDQGICQFILNLVRSFDTHKQPNTLWNHPLVNFSLSSGTAGVFTWRTLRRKWKISIAQQGDSWCLEKMRRAEPFVTLKILGISASSLARVFYLHLSRQS